MNNAIVLYKQNQTLNPFSSIEQMAMDVQKQAIDFSRKTADFARQAFEKWCEFTIHLMRIQKLKIHRMLNLTWDAYVRLKFNISSARYRQLRIALRYAKIISEYTGELPHEWELRNLAEVIKPDDIRVPATYLAGKRAAQLNNRSQPTKEDYKAAYEAVSEVILSGGNSTTDDNTMTAFDVSLNEHQYQEVQKKMQERQERLEQRTNWRTIKREIIELDNGLRILQLTQEPIIEEIL